MDIPLLQVDAFTSCQYCGNPAGVCLLPDAADPAWMQAVAAEMNLAETAFLVGFQASARGGVVRARVAGERVILGGQAVTTVVGELVDRARPV